MPGPSTLVCDRWYQHLGQHSTFYCGQFIEWRLDHNTMCAVEMWINGVQVSMFDGPEVTS
jgi:hypothetical protein